MGFEEFVREKSAELTVVVFIDKEVFKAENATVSEFVVVLNHLFVSVELSDIFELLAIRKPANERTKGALYLELVFLVIVFYSKYWRLYQQCAI